MNAQNYHVVIVITGQKILKNQSSFELLVEFEELFYAHFLLATFIDSKEHEEKGVSKVIHLNNKDPKDQKELEKHLKLADLVVCVGLSEKEEQFLQASFEWLPTDSQIIKIEDEKMDRSLRKLIDRFNN